jgi:hypothetical protein
MHLKQIACSPISSFPAAIRSGTLDAVMRCSAVVEILAVPIEIKRSKHFV